MNRPDDLPNGWCWTTIDLLSADSPHAIGAGPFGTIFKAHDFRPEGIPIIFLRHVQPGVYSARKPGFMDRLKWEELFREEYSVFGGELLVTKLGEPPGTAAIYPHGIGPAMVTPDVIKMTPRSDAAHAKYLMYYMNSKVAQSFASGVAFGTTRLRLTLPLFKSLPVPLSPFNEQRRIVAKIEELFSDLDAGVAALQRARANLKRYRASVLKSAVEGKLTADWRSQHPQTEPASALLQRILKERRAKWEADQLAKFAAAGKTPPKDWQQKYVEPTPPDTTGLPELPEGWAVASVDQVSTIITSGSRDWTQYYGTGTGTFIMAQNVRPGRLDLSYRQPVSPPNDDRDRVRSQVENDDLLVTIVGANTGDVCRVPSAMPEHYVCQSVALIRPVLREISEYAELYFTSDHGGQLHFDRYIYGQGRPHLSFDQIRMTPVVIPPLPEQSQIVNEVAEVLSQIDAAETAINHGLQRAARLRQSILKQAFEGKLVPQDPADEPASVLLERVSGGKAGKTVKPKRGRAKAAAKGETR